jgi:hypothetical protein
MGTGMTTPNRITKGEAIVASLIVEEDITTRTVIANTVTAATADLDAVTNVDTLDFDVTAVTTPAVARVRWNSTDGTLDVGMLGGNVTANLGQQEFMRVKHADNNGLAKGNVVYFVGSDGTNKTVRLATASVEASSVDVLGVMAETVTGGSTGWCCTYGVLKDINTNHLTEGTVAWLSASPGAVTSTKPSPPDHGVQIGYVTRKQQNNGSLFISVQNGYELDELHNVLISNPQNGDVLKYSASAGLWRNQQP